MKKIVNFVLILILNVVSHSCGSNEKSLSGRYKQGAPATQSSKENTASQDAIVPGADGNENENENMFKVIVDNGSGSGSFKAGTQVIIQANERDGYKFVDWVGDISLLTNKAVNKQTFVMPNREVSFVANYISNSDNDDTQPSIESPNTNPISTLGDPIKHKTDFLTVGRTDTSTRCFTHTYPGMDEGNRKKCRELLKSRGYTHIYIYIYNENDYKGPSFNYYNNPDEYVAILKELVADGLSPVVWLVPDDAPKLSRTNVETIKGYFTNVIAKIDPYVASYVLGLELDEYWGDREVKPLGSHLNTLTEKKIGVHCVGGSRRFIENDWADFLVFQYGFGKSAAQIEDITRTVISQIKGKSFVAGEYSLDNENSSIDLGNAALRGGAVGFGNGAESN